MKMGPLQDLILCYSLCDTTLIESETCQHTSAGDSDVFSRDVYWHNGLNLSHLAEGRSSELLFGHKKLSQSKLRKIKCEKSLNWGNLEKSRIPLYNSCWKEKWTKKAILLVAKPGPTNSPFFRSICLLSGSPFSICIVFNCCLAPGRR